MTTAAAFTLLIGAAAAFAPSQHPPATGRAAATRAQESKADLEGLATSLNPAVGFFDPLGIVENAEGGSGLWGQDASFTIGWFRQAEIKHGRVAMAAFVGYCVQSNFHFPWPETLAGDPFPSTDLSPPEQWDALPLGAKLQIIGFVGFLEIYSELSPKEGAEDMGQTHYCKGGVPGKYPDFSAVPHPVLFNSLYDPLGVSANMSPEKKERRLVMEINNGRLAMLGIFGFLSAQTVPGSVPALAGIVKPYAGEVMAPFEGNICDASGVLFC